MTTLRADEASVAARSAGLKRELGLTGLVFTQILFIVGLPWVGVAAKQGPAHVVFWLVALGNIEDAHEIRRAAVNAARLTKPLRSLSGGRRASTDVIDVNAVTARTAGSLERMLGPSIEVTLALDNDIKRIKVGASYLEEIVLNLGLHARDAMPRGGRLTVATTRHTPDKRDAASGAPREYVRMIVADTGGGMSAAAQSRLFEPFLASEEAGGSALGPAKVDAIVKQAGGRIQVESVAGVGTTFTIDLPATSEPVAARPALTEARLTAPVLVVEDDPRWRAHQAGPRARRTRNGSRRRPARRTRRVEPSTRDLAHACGCRHARDGRVRSRGRSAEALVPHPRRVHVGLCARCGAASEQGWLPRQAVYRRVAHGHRTGDTRALTRRPLVARAFPPPLAYLTRELRRGSPKRQRREGGPPAKWPPGSPEGLRYFHPT
jgi:Histidine kinase-, DNA gyrase B-, and HSP90-like ATPase